MKEEKIKFYNTVEVKKLGIPDFEIDCTQIENYTWDAFDDGEVENSKDPRSFIEYNSIVAIDFGTKSTVAVILNDKGNRIPIKLGEISKVKNSSLDKDIENPTILQFSDFRKFLKEYNNRVGRPYTNLNDIKTSWFAYNSNDINSYNSFRELKQWISTNNYEVYLEDLKKEKIKIYNFLEKQKGNIDPIEIYAYYLGSYINSFKNKKIYIKYIFSFPVTFTEKNKNEFIKSFEKGLKKSLPKSVLQDKSIMDKSFFKFVCSEPQAYAITAFEEFQLQPKENEKIMYSVYDFGGGTTDFDYGLIYKNDSDDDYKYTIESYWSSGDKSLGGENLLSYLAAFVAQKNKKILLNHRILVECPNEYIRPFSDLELLEERHKKNKYANKNSRVLIDILRDVWEGKISIKEEIKPDVSLIDQEGKDIEIPLKLNYEEIKLEIRKKIKEGIKKFFEEYIKYIKRIESNECDINCKKYIFLSGNSTRSEIFIEEFKTILEKINKESDLKLELYYPLGTMDAEKQLKNKSNEYDLGIEPNLKTGVAYGLLKTKDGSYLYNVVSKNKNINFELRDPKTKKVLIDTDSEINESIEPIKFIDGEYVLEYRFMDEKNWTREILTVPKDELEEINYFYLQIIDEITLGYKISNKKNSSEQDLNKNKMYFIKIKRNI